MKPALRRAHSRIWAILGLALPGVLLALLILASLAPPAEAPVRISPPENAGVSQ